METTRVQIVADLVAWARNDKSSNVYWLNGHLGTGKTSIAHSFSKCLDAEKMLGASFFCSRASFRDAGRIVPTIASMLARSHPTFRSSLRKALDEDPDVANLNFPSEQFKSLIIEPMKPIVDTGVIIIVIDGIDECSEREKV